MTDTGHMLIRTDPNGRPRLTKERKDELRVAVVALRVADMDSGRTPSENDQGRTRDDIVTTLIGLIERTATDRSCHSCDFLIKGRCSQFGQSPPDDFLETGCDQHQSVGIPF